MALTMAAEANADDREFTIRVTGASPPPLPSPQTAKKSNNGGGRGRGRTGKKDKAAPQQQHRFNLRLRPSTLLEQMRTDVFALFNVPSCFANDYQISFLGGFPPKELDQAGKRTVCQLGIRPNESLIVKFCAMETASRKSVAATIESAQKIESSPLAVVESGRQKRASALTASESFKEAMAAQDAILQKGKRPPKKKRASPLATGVVSLGKSSGRSNAALKRQKRVKMVGDGYRLSDGKTFAGSVPAKKGAVKPKIEFRSKDDIADTLLGKGRGSSAGKFLRSAMKNAVAKSYEASRATVRVTAVDQGEFEFQKVKGGSITHEGGVVLGTVRDHDPNNNGGSEDCKDADDSRTLFTVTYSKGIEGRGRYEEQVEIFGLSAVKAVLEMVYNDASANHLDDCGGESMIGKKDGRLRPVLIAELSPRAFWSLVYHCREAAKTDHNPTPCYSVENMLRSTLPHLDWSHLGRGGRMRALSEKARENLRQQKVEEDQTALGGPSQGQEEATRLVEDIEDSVMKLAEDDEGWESRKRERRARAAIARFGNVGDNSSPSNPQKSELQDDWKLVTPSEEDIDELVECIVEGVSPDSKHSEEDARVLAGILLNNVRNWRELANSNVDEIISKLNGRCMPVPSGDTVEGWIDAAQERTLEEIMVEIVDGDLDAVDMLRDKARSSTPLDLKRWEANPRMLLGFISGPDEAGKMWEITHANRWISRSKTALSVCSWLEEYTTPVAPGDVFW